MALQESAVDLNLTSLSIYWLPWKNGVLPANFFLPANFEIAITNNSQLAVKQSWQQLKCKSAKNFQANPERKMFIQHMCIGAKLLQLCLILCDAMDCSLPSSSVHGIL